MMQSLNDTIETLRQEILAVLAEISQRAMAFELPPDEGLAHYHQQLQDNQYTVLVVGEAKRGKSSFVNALLGRALLPTDVDIATSQVFRVSKSGQEGYRLRFADGSAQPISAADLPKYGSQVLAEAGELPRLDQIINWIEVDVPAARFLPDGVSLLDTPGLGALYAGHIQITQHFIRRADAVIYTLESEEPIVEPDVQTLEAILKVTPHVLFIQTKIDTVVREKWQEIQRRNEQILREYFGGRLTDTRVWPISNKNLLKAARTGNEDFVIKSHYPELAAALKQFLFRVAGVNRAATALLIANQYHGDGRKRLAGRLTTLMDPSNTIATQLQAQLAEREQAFEQEWGERGGRIQEVLKEVERVVGLGRQRFSQSLQPGGDLESAMMKRIENLSNLDQAKQLTATLNGEIIELAGKQWRLVTRQTQDHCLSLVQPFLAAVNDLDRPLQILDGGELPPVLTNDFGPVIQDDPFERLKSGFIEQGVVGGVAYTVLSIVFPPLAVVAAVIGSLFGFLHGTFEIEQRQLREAQQKLAQYLDQVLKKTCFYLFSIDLSSARRGTADEYFDKLTNSLGQALRDTAQQKQTELQAEINRLKEQIKLDDQQRDAQAEGLRQQLGKWDGLGNRLQTVHNKLAALDKNLSASATSAAA